MSAKGNLMNVLYLLYKLFQVCSPIEEYLEAAAYTLYPVDTPENSVMWESWADKSNNPSKVPTLITNPKKVMATVVVDYGDLTLQSIYTLNGILKSSKIDY